MAPYFRFGPLLATDYNVVQNASNITICPYGVHWIWMTLGDCVSSTQEQVSAYLGLISLALWMCVGIPQIVQNFRNLDGLSGISFLLLLQWAGGDITNLTGAILTSQLKLQIYLASYFVMTDVVLLSQYSVFIMRRKRKRTQELRVAADPTPRLILCLMGLAAFSHGFSDYLASPSLLNTGPHPTFEGHVSRSLLSVKLDKNESFPLELGQRGNYRLQMVHGSGKDVLTDTASIFWHDRVSVLGYIIGILSSIFYLGSRMAQIYKNKQLQSTQGLAILTFMLAIIGNLTYGAQILVRDVSTEFLLEKIPWLVGSLGVVGLDCILLFQFRYYSRRHRDIPEIRRALLSKEYAINTEDGDIDYIY